MLQRIAPIIHPMWAIEEKANIFLILDWYRPPRDPTRAEQVRLLIKSILGGLLKFKIIRGVTFCQVNNIIIGAHSIFSAMEGTHR